MSVNTPASTAYQHKLVAVLSINYLTFSCMLQSLCNSVYSLGFPVIQSQSAFWDKGLSTCFEKALEMHPEYIVTIDHDSVFSPSDIQELVRLMDANPDLLAIFPVQASRHKDEPLVVMPDKDYSTEITRVDFGHFGCTVIRADMLRKMPQPWLMGLPNPNSGKWTEEPVSDSDITFWRFAKVHGFSVAQANKVHIGHAQICVRWIGDKGLGLQPWPVYQSEGKPSDVNLNPDIWGSTRKADGNGYPVDNGQP